MTAGGDETYGAQFLAERRRLGGSVGSWKYEVVMAIERADRMELVELLKRGSPSPSAEIIEAALSDGPESLARRVVEQGRIEDILPLIILGM